MSVHISVLGYDLKGTFVDKLDDKRNNFVVRIEDKKSKDFVHIPYVSDKAIAHDRKDLVGAFRKILLSATYGANKPEVFCAMMHLKPDDPKAPKLFEKARKLTEDLDELIPLTHHTRWFDMAKKLTQQGVSSDLG